MLSNVYYRIFFLIFINIVFKLKMINASHLTKKKYIFDYTCIVRLYK